MTSLLKEDKNDKRTEDEKCIDNSIIFEKNDIIQKTNSNISLWFSIIVAAFYFGQYHLFIQNTEHFLKFSLMLCFFTFLCKLSLKEILDFFFEKPFSMTTSIQTVKSFNTCLLVSFFIFLSSFITSLAIPLISYLGLIK